jgi:hypothetical protein
MISEDPNVSGISTDAQEATENDDLLSVIELIQIITQDINIRTVESVSTITGDRLFRVPNPGNRFVHYVPPPLRHFGCMWLAEGDEHQRCGRPVAWTMGADLSLARLYCENHGQIILQRRRLNYERATMQKRRSGEVEPASDHKSPPQHHDAAGDEYSFPVANASARAG